MSDSPVPTDTFRSALGAAEIIRLFNRSHTFSSTRNTLFVERLMAAGLTDQQIAAVLTVLDGTCQECWDRPAACGLRAASAGMTSDLTSPHHYLNQCQPTHSQARSALTGQPMSPPETKDDSTHS